MILHEVVITLLRIFSDSLKKNIPIVTSLSLIYLKQKLHKFLYSKNCFECQDLNLLTWLVYHNVYIENMVLFFKITDLYQTRLIHEKLIPFSYWI